jgi:hypothetical protein
VLHSKKAIENVGLVGALALLVSYQINCISKQHIAYQIIIMMFIICIAFDLYRKVASKS